MINMKEKENSREELIESVKSQMLAPDDVDVTAEFFKALADPTIINIVNALQIHEWLCVTDLAEILGMTKSAVSHQLCYLRLNNLVMVKREGQRVYYALCEGNIEKDLSIDKNIETVPNQLGYNSNKRITSNNGKPAITHVQIIKNYNDYCLVKITLEHGRTHQIRVHLSSIGHALLGDSLYGKKSNLISHTALVCKEMHFTMPDGRNIDLSIPFPKDFEALLRD